jgi:hypothetical protein
MLAAMADDHNPYAPPAAEPDDAGRPRRAFSDEYDDGPNEFESQREPVFLTVVLSFVTLGFYPAIWLLRRRPFLDRQDTGAELGMALPVMMLVMTVLSVIVVFAGGEAAGVSRLFSLGAAIASLVARYRVLAILRSVSTQTGRFLGFSSAATFFLGVFYLQYKMNQMADTPARRERPRKKKKRKKLEARAVAEADADAELRAEEEARKLGAPAATATTETPSTDAEA